MKKHTLLLAKPRATMLWHFSGAVQYSVPLESDTCWLEDWLSHCLECDFGHIIWPLWISTQRSSNDNSAYGNGAGLKKSYKGLAGAAICSWPTTCDKDHRSGSCVLWCNRKCDSQDPGERENSSCSDWFFLLAGNWKTSGFMGRWHLKGVCFVLLWRFVVVRKGRYLKEKK